MYKGRSEVMRKILILTLVLALTLTVGIALTGCDGSSGFEGESSIGCIGRISTEFEGMGFWIWRAEFTPSG